MEKYSKRRQKSWSHCQNLANKNRASPQKAAAKNFSRANSKLLQKDAGKLQRLANNPDRKKRSRALKIIQIRAARKMQKRNTKSHRQDVKKSPNFFLGKIYKFRQKNYCEVFATQSGDSEIMLPRKCERMSNFCCENLRKKKKRFSQENFRVGGGTIFAGGSILCWSILRRFFVGGGVFRWSYFGSILGSSWVVSFSPGSPERRDAGDQPRADCSSARSGRFLGPIIFLAGEFSHGGSWISSCFFWLEGCTRLLIAINSHLSIEGRKVCVCETLIFLFGDFFLLASCSDTLRLAIYHWGFPDPDCVQITTPRTLPRYYPKSQLEVFRLTPRGLPRSTFHSKSHQPPHR